MNTAKDSPGNDLSMSRDDLLARLKRIEAELGVLQSEAVESRRMAEELRALKLAVENMQLGVTITDPEGKILYTNPAEAGMHGFTRDDLLGQSVKMLAPPTLWKSAVVREVPPIKSFHRESLNIRKNGTTFPVRLLSDIVTDDRGQPLGIVTTCEDITERKRIEEELRAAREDLERKVADRTAELSATVLALQEEIVERQRAQQALSESERSFRSLIELSPDGIIILDTTGEIGLTNPAMVRILGSGSELEVVGRNLFTFITPEHQEHCRECFTKICSGIVQSQEMETSLRRPDGIKVPVEVSAGWSEWQGKPVVQMMVRDITQRKLAEKERERVQAQLLQSQKMEAVGQLSAGVAHDFNNLLTSILGYTGMLMMKADPSAPHYQDLKKVEFAAVQAARLTRQLLLFSRKAPMDSSPLNLNRTVEELLKMLQRLIGEDIVIETDLDPDLWLVKADEGNLDQVVMNLVVNARDAMHGGGEVVIATRNVTFDTPPEAGLPESRMGSFVKLSVSDTGSGIPHEILPRIFEPFFTTKEKGAGTGLGLSVVYGIVSQHRGWLAVESRPGGGTTFNIFLPAYPFLLGAEKARDEDLLTLRGRGEWILVVEDDSEVRDLLSRSLGENGYNVAAAASASEAATLFAGDGGKIRLLFSDVVLPDKTGLQLAEQLLAQRPGLVILLGSGYSEQKSQQQAIRAKGFAFMAKPYAVTAILRMIRELLPPRT